MFGTTLGAGAYAKVGVETGVVAASPHKLVLMLFEGAMVAITTATQAMQSGDLQSKGKAISKAISIIDNGLRASLDKKAGGDIATNLHSLYEYMSNRLLTAHINNDQAMLDEVYELVKGLKDSWEAIGNTATAPAADIAMPRMPQTSDPLEPQVSRMVKA